jgi:uncharacterized membrane protein
MFGVDESVYPPTLDMKRCLFRSFVSVITQGISMTLAIALPQAVILANAQASANAAPQVATFSGGGTEPFWGIEVSPKGITYTSINGPKTVFPYVRPLKASGQMEDSLRLYKLRGGNTLIIQRNTCSDGMSDNTYNYSVIMVLQNQVFTGCATKK